MIWRELTKDLIMRYSHSKVMRDSEAYSVQSWTSEHPQRVILNNKIEYIAEHFHCCQVAMTVPSLVIRKLIFLWNSLGDWNQCFGRGRRSWAIVTEVINESKYFI